MWNNPSTALTPACLAASSGDWTHAHAASPSKVFGINLHLVTRRASKEADKAAAAAAKEERLKVMQERLAAWQASQAK